MPKDTQLKKNLILTDELTEFILKHPDAQKGLPKKASIVVFSEKDKELTKANKSLLKSLLEKGEKVTVAIKTGSRSKPWRFESSQRFAPTA